MPSPAVYVTAASRLHFGLMSVGTSAPRQFGGVGVMVAPPQTKLSIIPAGQFTAEGPGAERVREFVQLWQQFQGLEQPPPCRVVVESLPPMHAGLGVGTQLGLSIARGLNAFCQRPDPTPDELARSVQRGMRSAVGTYGFLHGGLVFEPGKTNDESLGPLGRTIALPEQWRFVLIRPDQDPGLHGEAERRAFATLHAVSSRISHDLWRIASEEILPAAHAGDFRAFSESVYRFGYQSGLSFATVQGGAYNGPQLTALVETVRELGVQGVGQSSWGPTIFALCPTQLAAEQLVQSLESSRSRLCATCTIASPWNKGGEIGWRRED